MKRVFAYSTVIKNAHKEPKNLENFINSKIGELEALDWEIWDVDVILRGLKGNQFIVLIFAKPKKTGK